MVDPGPLGGDLFGAHVEEGAEHLSRLGQLQVTLDAGQTEVGQLGLIVARDHRVGGLDVAVYHPLVMGVLDSIGHARYQACDRRVVVRREVIFIFPEGDRVLQCEGTLNQLHGDPGDAVMLAVAVDGDDVRVCQPPTGARLACEQSVVAFADAVGPDELEGDATGEGDLLRLPDLAHAPRTEDGDQAEVPDNRARRQGSHTWFRRVGCPNLPTENGVRVTGHGVGLGLEAGAGG